MTVKKLAGGLHLWLGFVAGLIVLISLLAASIFVWEEELNAWYHHDKVYVKEVKPHRLPFATILANAQKASNNDTDTYVNIENDPQKAYVFINYKAAARKGWTWASGVADYSRIHVDPYTGEVLGKIDLRYDWIFNMRMLHQCLLLNYDVGHYIVGGATLVLVIMIITGIILWWPKNKAAFKQRIWFRWKKTTQWKRKNYDFHNIGGIYTFLFILFFALTGLVWTFDWWENAIYRMMGNHPDKVYRKAPAPDSTTLTADHPYDIMLADITNGLPAWHEMGFNIVAASAKPTGINAFIRYRSGRSGWDESDSYTYHPQTGKLYFATTQDQKTLGAKWRNSNYAMHVGSIYGLPTKILATFISLFCASLPVSGFYIWWGRKKKKNKKASPGSASRTSGTPVLQAEMPAKASGTLTRS